jgi:predicted RNA-binding Zn-ribbon protein involved in translation (DUF1610 family)
MSIKFSVQFIDSNYPQEEEWTREIYYCPRCGQREVWCEISGADYTLGRDYLCRACGAAFTLPSGAEVRKDDFQDQQRLKILRAES